MLAAFRENEEANSSSSASSSRNSRAASSAVGVPLTHKLTAIAPLSSSYAGRVTVPSFISTHPTTGNPVVPHASQPPVSALSAQSLFDSPFTTIDQQPDLGAFGWESICSRPQLSTNTGKMVTK